MSPLSPLLAKERREFEDSLRKNLLLLESRGLHEEAEDLVFRLQQKMGEEMVKYLAR